MGNKNSGGGGARPGSGRKKGISNVKTQAIAARAFEEGITPLEFMLNVMRQPIPKKATDEEKSAIKAAQFEAAKSAAPYIHPRLAAVAHSGKDGGDLNMCLRVLFGKE
ncbi:hypothetical protein UFOVP891_39 [uncultured Caudovirales phage]|uniref:Uncharacterized protein n=1 Tax=uncultured Caudovirales phage TaxID=2100421 RepID=A0A6J5RNY1_9CAUD|nr:hypothetical protein UFOVP472_28 [uncultured Caudovirales phage]CAB4169137.1 hypothetical protein UFOVP891_39 [uncultured Caudovirales phage]CAB4180768.1 hypothetical protein UFOVP1053_28 [uncultured Caudovirales phage]CAB4195926.1 hypothetical protein UFOVP1297_45 [uncultured Caudovirales phage]CAB4221887.1 hypothetical protein UFOVP1647_23 [uncultured Caudovirales phage]